MTQQEINDFYLTSNECNFLYSESCACVPTKKNQEQLGISISTYSSFVDQFGKFRNVWDGMDRDDVIATFQWQDRLNDDIPIGLCVARSMEKYLEVGPLSREHIVDILVARKNADTAKAEAAMQLEKIVPPESDGAYIVSKELGLMKVQFAGRMDDGFNIVDSLELPEEFRTHKTWYDDRAAISCLSINDADIVSAKHDDFMVFT